MDLQISSTAWLLQAANCHTPLRKKHRTTVPRLSVEMTAAGICLLITAALTSRRLSLGLSLGLDFVRFPSLSRHSSPIFLGSELIYNSIHKLHILRHHRRGKTYCRPSLNYKRRRWFYRSLRHSRHRYREDHQQRQCDGCRSFTAVHFVSSECTSGGTEAA
jgi:hypothetical protein